jgi:hypothetical protein
VILFKGNERKSENKLKLFYPPQQNKTAVKNPLVWIRKCSFFLGEQFLLHHSIAIESLEQKKTTKHFAKDNILQYKKKLGNVVTVGLFMSEMNALKIQFWPEKNINNVSFWTVTGQANLLNICAPIKNNIL